MAKQPPYVKHVRARGNDYYYFDTGKDVKGKRKYVRLPDKKDKMDWGHAYAAQLGARSKRDGLATLPNLGDVARLYENSPKFADRSDGTQRTYSFYIEKLVDLIGADALIDDIKRKDIQLIMDKTAGTPQAANMMLLVARNIFAYAIKREMIPANPTAGIEMYAGKREYEPWPQDLLDAALADDKIKLPVALLLYTAQRIGDVCRIRWTDIEDGHLNVTQQKTGKLLSIPLHSDLKAILDVTPRTAMTILFDSKGRPAKTQTVRTHLQDFASKRGFKVEPHGLRKNAVIALLEAGCTTGETSSISGQSLRIVEHYAKRRDNKKMAGAAILKWEKSA
jgi:integrase